MLVDELTTYQSWDLERPFIPPRSRLYHLEPIGVGTPYVESLTGYVARLAETHRLSIRTLILAEINPLAKEGYVFNGRGLEQKEYIYGGNRNTKTLNGTGLKATHLVQALEALTLRSDLRYLTMLTWADVLSCTGLTRSTKAWCPSCYENWNTTGQVEYEPLIWTIEVVTVCPRHHRRLQTQCPHCHKHASIFSQLGHCSKCRGWLGISPESDFEALPEDELKWQHWVVNNVGDLLLRAPRLSSPLPKERVKEAISAYVNQVSIGSLFTLAHLCGGTYVQWFDKLRGWHSGEKIPQLDSLLHFCYSLETSLVDFLTKEEVVIVNFDRLVTLLQDKKQTKPKISRKQHDWDRMRAILQTSLNESPPPSLIEVCKRFDCPKSTLYNNLPDLCNAISSQYADYKKAKLLEEMRGAGERPISTFLNARGSETV